MLIEQMQEELKLLGLNVLNHPIFYNSNYGIRFEIGVGDVYGNDGTPGKEYVENALTRAITIYNNGIKHPELLMWEVYTQKDKEKQDLKSLFMEKIAPVLPEEEFLKAVKIDGNNFQQTQFFWNLRKSEIPMDSMFREIILGDLGGLQELASSVYLFDTKNHVMLHLYDDRGLDIVAHDKNTLMPLFQELNAWILDYDRKQIDKLLFG